MNNLWSWGCSQVRSMSDNNIKLRIITSLEQRKSMLRFVSPTYSRKHIFLANKITTESDNNSNHYRNRIANYLRYNSIGEFVFINIKVCLITILI